MPRLGVAAAIVVMAGGAPPAFSQAADGPLAHRIALAFGDSTGSCVMLPDSVARTHPSITILWPPTDQVGGKDAHVFRARVGNKRQSCSFGEDGYALDGARLADHVSYLAVIGATGRAHLERDRIDVDLTGDGKLESVRVCTSQEGVHFTVWSGPTLRSKRLAHQYAPLGYDVEPSCRPAEYAEP